MAKNELSLSLEFLIIPDAGRPSRLKISNTSLP